MLPRCQVIEIGGGNEVFTDFHIDSRCTVEPRTGTESGGCCIHGTGSFHYEAREISDLKVRI